MTYVKNMAYLNLSLILLISRKRHSLQIDRLLINNSNDVPISGVGEPFLNQTIRYHNPVFCVRNFNKQKTNIFKKLDQGDYQALSNELGNTNWESFKDVDVNKYTNNLTEHIIKSSTKHIPNKVINIRPSDPSWLNTNIKKLITKRKRFYTKYKKTRANSDYEAYKKIRNHVNKEIRKSKQDVNDKFAEKQ